MKALKNIFRDIPYPYKLESEFFEEILSAKNFKLERIVSQGHASPENFWYDQQENEFALLLSGSAKISFDNGEISELNTGDYLIINAHQKHRVDWTSPEEKTFWLTIHY